MEEILRFDNISKRFGSFYANKDISFPVYRGEVHTLLGENGAGKSTLMNILIGLYQPTSGTIYYEGQPVHFESPAQAVEKGIGMVHQHFMLVEAMTAFENIILGDRNSKGLFINRAARKKEIKELSLRYGLDVDLDKQITDLSVGAQQRVEILKALYHGADLLVLDEPTAALTDKEAEGLFEIIRKLISENKAVIFISHKMREVMRISDRITVLRLGELVTTLPCSQTNPQELANLMMGHELAVSHYEKKIVNTPPVLDLNTIEYQRHNKHNGLAGISLQVHRGEIVGIAGVDGNGQTQLAQIVSSIIAPEKGTVDLKGSHISIFDPHNAIYKGVSHIPEDRNAQGLIGDMSIADNLILKSNLIPRFKLKGGHFLNNSKISAYARESAEKYDIRSLSINQDVRSLSGGNQQKVILARELNSDPDLLIAAHPTRGLDIGAARFIHDEMIKVRDKGTGVLLISADFDEIIEMSDRIIVLFEGQIVGEYSGKNPPIEEINLAMTGK